MAESTGDVLQSFQDMRADNVVRVRVEGMWVECNLRVFNLRSALVQLEYEEAVRVPAVNQHTLHSNPSPFGPSGY